MLESLLGSLSAEQVLIYLQARGEGYSRQIARFYPADYRSIRNQLERLEAAGILYGRAVGRTRLFGFNPRYPFHAELRQLLGTALDSYPKALREKLTLNRRRPRRSGKPL